MKSSTNIDKGRPAWLDETGDLPVPMTNDYMFKAVCQEDNFALKSLICAVLHKDEEEVKSAIVGNPILLGKAIDEKEYILDAKVELNDNMLLDLELQVLNDHDWPERSLHYLCRIFDSLHRGENYKDSKAAMHIGILDFKLHEDSPLLESYLLMDKLNHRVYTEKFQIHIMTLKEADKPGSEDVRFHTNVWAKYFAARTWEDLKMLAQKDKGVASAITTAHRLWQEDEIKARAIAREDFINTQKAREARWAEAEREKAEAERAQAEAERAKAEAERAKTEAEKRAAAAEAEAARLQEELRKYKSQP